MRDLSGMLEEGGVVSQQVITSMVIHCRDCGDDLTFRKAYHHCNGRKEGVDKTFYVFHGDVHGTKYLDYQQLVALNHSEIAHR